MRKTVWISFFRHFGCRRWLGESIFEQKENPITLETQSDNKLKGCRSPAKNGLLRIDNLAHVFFKNKVLNYGF